MCSSLNEVLTIRNRYTAGNIVLRCHMNRALKQDLMIDIPPQNMIILILMHLCTDTVKIFISSQIGVLQAACHHMNGDIKTST